MINDFIYDIETYPNVFTLTVEHAYAPLRWVFEISDHRNDSREIIEFCRYLKSINARMVGFNNLGFDYPILHMLIKMGKSDAQTLYNKCQSIIQSQDNENRWAHQVYESDRYVDQIDLFKIHHFDNQARATSLKILEFNMRSDTVQELPFKVGTILNKEQIELLKEYNLHDVQQTKKFYFETLDMIRFREELTKKYKRDFMNHNDTKIGKDYFIMRLEESGVACYDFGPDGRTPRQTKRPIICLEDAILPWIKFENPEFTRVLEWLKAQAITETKGVFKDLTATINGFTFVFGLGGIHGSVENKIIEADKDYAIVDLDVSSYYPNLAIVNGFHPQHLGKEFCKIYKNLYEQRKSHKKGSAENAMLKLALNGVYGDSNSKFSVFYDPLFTMSITLNGQLLLCKLVEMILPICEIIQINTDGITIRLLRKDLDFLKLLYDGWEHATGMLLEGESYSKIFIRDVNNYIGEYENDLVKRKGCYEHDLEWHQNHSALVIPKVAEQVLLDNKPIRETLENWPDVMDFMLRTKVPRSSHLTIEHPGSDPIKVQNITRYYVAKGGGHLFKWMPPLKGKTEWRRFAVQSGWGVQICDDIKDAGKLPIDYDYYVQEVEKICLGLN